MYEEKFGVVIPTSIFIHENWCNQPNCSNSLQSSPAQEGGSRGQAVSQGAVSWVLTPKTKPSSPVCKVKPFQVTAKTVCSDMTSDSKVFTGQLVVNSSEKDSHTPPVSLSDGELSTDSSILTGDQTPSPVASVPRSHFAREEGSHQITISLSYNSLVAQAVRRHYSRSQAMAQSPPLLSRHRNETLLESNSTPPLHRQRLSGNLGYQSRQTWSWFRSSSERDHLANFRSRPSNSPSSPSRGCELTWRDTYVGAASRSYYRQRRPARSRSRSRSSSRSLSRSPRRNRSRSPRRSTSRSSSRSSSSRERENFNVHRLLSEGPPSVSLATDESQDIGVLKRRVLSTWSVDALTQVQINKWNVYVQRYYHEYNINQKLGAQVNFLKSYKEFFLQDPMFDQLYGKTLTSPFLLKEMIKLRLQSPPQLQPSLNQPTGYSSALDSTMATTMSVDHFKEILSCVEGVCPKDSGSSANLETRIQTIFGEEQKFPQLVDEEENTEIHAALNTSSTPHRQPQSSEAYTADVDSSYNAPCSPLKSNSEQQTSTQAEQGSTGCPDSVLANRIPPMEQDPDCRSPSPEGREEVSECDHHSSVPLEIN